MQAAARPTAAAAMPALAAGLIFLGRLAGSGRQEAGLTRSGSGSCEAEFVCGGIGAALVWAYIRLALPQLVQNFESPGISFLQAVQYISLSFYSLMFMLE